MTDHYRPVRPRHFGQPVARAMLQSFDRGDRSVPMVRDAHGDLCPDVDKYKRQKFNAQRQQGWSRKRQ